MAIAIDGSTPAIAEAIGDVTTAAFSPPAGSLLVACLGGVLDGDVAPSNSGTARTWTEQIADTGGFYVAIYTALNPTALSGITVSTGSDHFGGLKVFVVTGIDTDDPIGQTGRGTSATNNATVTGYSSTISGSRGLAVAVETNNLGVPTSTDNEETFSAAGQYFGMTLSKAANTAVSGTNVTFNLDASGSGAAGWQWAALEVLPMAEARPVRIVPVVGQAVTRSTVR